MFVSKQPVFAPKTEKSNTISNNSMPAVKNPVYKSTKVHGLTITTRNEKEQKECNKIIQEMQKYTRNFISVSNHYINANKTLFVRMYERKDPKTQEKIIYNLVCNIYNINTHNLNKPQEYEINWGIYRNGHKTKDLIQEIPYHGIKDMIDRYLPIMEESFRDSFINPEKYKCPPPLDKLALHKYEMNPENKEHNEEIDKLVINKTTQNVISKRSETELNDEKASFRLFNGEKEDIDDDYER